MSVNETKMFHDSSERYRVVFFMWYYFAFIMLKNEIQNYFSKIWSERLILLVRRERHHNQILKIKNKNLWTSILRQSERMLPKCHGLTHAAVHLIYLVSLGQIAKQGYCFNVRKCDLPIYRKLICKEYQLVLIGGFG